MRITADLVTQQKELLVDLDPDIRAGVIDVIRRLAGGRQPIPRRSVRVGQQQLRPEWLPLICFGSFGC